MMVARTDALPYDLVVPLAIAPGPSERVPLAPLRLPPRYADPESGASTLVCMEKVPVVGSCTTCARPTLGAKITHIAFINKLAQAIGKNLARGGVTIACWPIKVGS